MNIIEQDAKSLLRKSKKIDSWFLSRYGMNLYRGCEHDCIYCDGRAEKYNVSGVFEKDIIVKTNAVELLSKELSPKRKRKPMKQAYIILGGGVGDSYQPIEKEYQITRKVLKLLCNFHYPVHVLTKSTLVLRDIDLLKKINDKSRVITSFSFSSTNEKAGAIFEAGVPLPDKRLDAVRRLRDEGLHCGMFLMPVIPFITDSESIMEKTIKDAKDAGIEFIIFGGMTLKAGRQEEYFMKCIEKYYPSLVKSYQNLYENSGKYGSANKDYYIHINRRFISLAKKYKMPIRIPISLYNDILDINDLAVVMLEHIDYLVKRQGKDTPYSYSAYQISKLEKPLYIMKDDLKSIKGVGEVTEKLLKEIIETRNCKYLNMLLYK